MRLYSKVSLVMTYSGDTPVIDYDIQYASGDRASGKATRDFWIQLMSQFCPNEMTLLQGALYPTASAPTTPTPTTPATTTTVATNTVPGVNVKVGL